MKSLRDASLSFDFSDIIYLELLLCGDRVKYIVLSGFFKIIFKLSLKNGCLSQNSFLGRKNDII